MIHLVTDTTAYLPPDFIESRGIYTVSLKINVRDKTIDEDKISLDEFYTYVASVEKAPSTSQPPPGEFIRLYESLTRNGDEVLSIHISGGISGTPLVAKMAAQDVAPDKITVVDSRVTSVGLAMMIRIVLQAIDNGATRAEAATLAERISEQQATFFLVETLDYLAKGGRINGAAKFLGSMLNLRPILYFDEQGKIEGMSVAHTRKKGVQRMLREIQRRLGDGPIHAGVTHVQCEADAQALAAKLQEQFECVDIFVTETGPVIGSHVGPGLLGISACPAQA